MKPWTYYAHQHAHHWRPYRFWGGRRIMWFLIGAGTATLWHKAHQAREWNPHCYRHRIPQGAYPPPGAPVVAAAPVAASAVPPTPMTPPVPVSPTSDSSAPPQPQEGDRRWGWSWSSDKGFKSWGGEHQASQTQPQSQQTRHVPPVPMPYDEEKERLQALGKQATEVLSDLSEATLESVLATVQSLKAKLAESRAEREKQLAQMEALKQEQFKMFEQWKKQQEEEDKKKEPRHLV